MTDAAPAIRRYERSTPGRVAERLFRCGWLPERPRSTILIVHGFAEHAGRYEHVGRWLAERGHAVHAYDHVGHGQSSGRRCYVERFDDFLEDLAHVLEQVRSDAPERPTFLIGHSMGGLIAARFALERPAELAGVVLSGPALGLAEGTPRFRLHLARWIRVLAPRLALPAGLDLEGLCSDPAVVEAYLADPLVERKVTAALAAELSRAVGETGGRGADLKLPLLVLHGSDDTLCPAAASEAFAAAAPEGRFVRYPGLRHEIFNEPSREQVLAEVGSWLDQRLAR